MGRHHGGHALGDRGPKGGQLHGLEAFAAVADQGQLQVRIAAGVAMAREVLGAGQHPFGLHAPGEGGGQGAGASGRFAPGPHVDHGVGRVVVHITHRPQHPVEADGAGIAAGAAAITLGQGDGPFGIVVVQLAQGQGGHQPGGPFKALTHPLFHIGAQQQLLARPLAQLLAAQAHLCRRAPKQDHPSHPLGEQVLEFGIGEFPAGIAALVVGEMAAGSHHQQFGDQARQISAHRGLEITAFGRFALLLPLLLQLVEQAQHGGAALDPPIEHKQQVGGAPHLEAAAQLTFHKRSG